MGEAGSVRSESRGCTLADLLLLTVGVAVAVALRWHTLTGFAATTPYVFETGWLNPANIAIEALGKACAALIPVILFRRWRYGGPIRPAEYLPIFSGLRQLAYTAVEWPIFGVYYPSPTAPGGVQRTAEAFFRWNLALTAVGVLAAGMVAARRRRRDWVMGCSIAVAYTFLTKQAIDTLHDRAHEFYDLLPGPLATPPVPWAIVSWVIWSTIHLPWAIAACDCLRQPRRVRTWVEWASIGLGSLAVLLVDVRILTYQWDVMSGRIKTFHSLVSMAVPIASIAASYAIARWTEPAWRRLLGVPGVVGPGNPGARTTNAGVKSR